MNLDCYPGVSIVVATSALLRTVLFLHPVQLVLLCCKIDELKRLIKLHMQRMLVSTQ